MNNERNTLNRRSKHNEWMWKRRENSAKPLQIKVLHIM